MKSRLDPEMDKVTQSLLKWWYDENDATIWCSICGLSSKIVYMNKRYRVEKRIDFHHVLPKGSHAEAKYDKKNLKPLCFDCHRKVTDNKIDMKGEEKT